MGSGLMSVEILEQEKKKILSRLSKSSSKAPQDLNTEAIYKMIRKKMEKVNVENPDLGNRNYMLPSYH